MQSPDLPVGDVHQEVFFKKPAPLLQDVEEARFEDLGVDPEPSVEHFEILQLTNFNIQTFKIIDLSNRN